MNVTAVEQLIVEIVLSAWTNLSLGALEEKDNVV